MLDSFGNRLDRYWTDLETVSVTDIRPGVWVEPIPGVTMNILIWGAWVVFWSLVKIEWRRKCR